MRIDVNQLRAALARHHGEPEADRMRFGHVRAHDQNAVGILHVFLKASGRAAAERGAQTGHRSAVSYSSLIFDRYDAQAQQYVTLN